MLAAIENASHASGAPVCGGVQIERLSSGAPAFAAFGYARLACHLSPVRLPWIAVGARVAGVPAGLAFGIMLQSGTGDPLRAQMLSLAMSPAARRKGIGSALARAFVEECLKEGAVEVRVSYTSRLPHREALEGCLQSAGFDVPELKELITFGEAGPLLAAGDGWPAVRRRLRQPAFLTFEPWAPLTEADRAALEDLRRQPGYEPGFDPAPDAERFEPACSIVIRRGGQLAGWVTAETGLAVPLQDYRDRPVIVYRSAYITQELWSGGWLLGGYRAVLAAQTAHYGPSSIAQFYTSSPRKMQMVRRRFGTIALQVDEHWVMRSAGCRQQTPSHI